MSHTQGEQGEAATNAIGLPMPRSGNFADVYEFNCPGSKKWAIKCFTREVPGLRDRYSAISMAAYRHHFHPRSHPLPGNLGK